MKITGVCGLMLTRMNSPNETLSQLKSAKQSGEIGSGCVAKMVRV